MFTLVHKREDGDMNGTWVTVVGVSEKKETLEEKTELIKIERELAFNLYNNLLEDIDSNPDPKRETPSTKTETEKDRIRAFEKELDEKYPYWGLNEGFHGESFDIEEVEVF